MSTQPFQKLLALVEFDKEITTCAAAREKLRHEIVQEQAKIDELEMREQSYKDAEHEARKHVDASELEMRSLEQKETRKKKLIDVANNLKEFNSAKAELATVHETMGMQEEHVLEAWKRLEQAQKIFAAFQAERPQALAALQTTLSEKFQSLKEIDDTIARLHSERPHIQAEVPEEWLKQYTTMHTAVDEPVVPLNDEACSRCYSPIPLYLVNRIERGAVLPCKGCFRLLYAPAFHNSSAKQ